jgi:hypothetical protein
VPIAIAPVLDFAPPNGLEILNPAFLLQFISASERHYPTLISAIEISSRHQVKLPPGYTYVSVPTGKSVRNAAGHFESHYSLTPDGQLVIDRVLSIGKDRHPADQYPALREVLLAAYMDMKTNVTAETKL